MNITPELKEAVEDVIEWLDYVPTSPEDTIPSIERLRNAYIRALVQEQRDARTVLVPRNPMRSGINR